MTYGKRGITIRITYLFVATLFFIFKKIKRNTHPEAIVLCYHGITDVQRESFARQMHMAAKRAISIKTLNSMQENAQKSLSVCVTFDDAFANLIKNVLPTINKLQIPITIFIATKSIGSFPAWLNGTKHSDACEMVMTASQISALKKNPFITFGSHTSSHPHLSQLQKENIREELRSSRSTLEGILSEQVDTLALPHGDYNKEVLLLAMEEGYKNIFTLEPIPYISEDNSLFHMIGRFSMSPMVWPIEFFLTINGAYSWLGKWRFFIHTCRSFIQ
jgi:peptidoglycan/xylan/chitin deacetylase (PgdA/CDA1 family)